VSVETDNYFRLGTGIYNTIYGIHKQMITLSIVFFHALQHNLTRFQQW